VKQKNDNLVELERAREDVIRLKTGHKSCASVPCQGETFLDETHAYF
jgi:hypothetical protein